MKILKTNGNYTICKNIIRYGEVNSVEVVAGDFDVGTKLLCAHEPKILIEEDKVYYFVRTNDIIAVIA